MFSKPMVTIGKIPDRVTAPFVKISPATDSDKKVEWPLVPGDIKSPRVTRQGELQRLTSSYGRRS